MMMITRRDIERLETRVDDLKRDADLNRQRIVALETALETEREWRKHLEERLKAYEEQKKARADAPDYTGIIDEWLNGDKEGRKE